MNSQPAAMTTTAVLDPNQRLTVEELAEREDVTVRTVYKWNRENTGPRYMRIGRRAVYKLSDVIAWENTRYVGGEPPNDPR